MPPQCAALGVRSRNFPFFIRCIRDILEIHLPELNRIRGSAPRRREKKIDSELLNCNSRWIRRTHRRLNLPALRPDIPLGRSDLRALLITRCGTMCIDVHFVGSGSRNHLQTLTSVGICHSYSYVVLVIYRLLSADLGGKRDNRLV